VGISLITDLPIWFTFLCLAVGGGYAFLLYRKDPLLKEIAKWQAYLIAGSRFLLVSLLCFLLLGPMVKIITREIEKPIVILALDASQSIINSKDSSKLVESYKASLEKLKVGLSNDYDLKVFSYGDHVRENLDFNFKDKETDFSTFYDEIDTRFANRNVGAIILASDGLYNLGGNPVYGPSRIKVPIFTVAFGDTTVRKDLLISRVNANRIAFLGNSFQMEVVVDAKQCASSKATLTVSEDSVVLFSRPLEISGTSYHANVPLFLDAKKKGIHHYIVAVTSLDGEVTYANNKYDVFIEVVENKQKVLVINAAPNPDISAIRNALESSTNYELISVLSNEFNGKLSDYNLVILHGIPSVNSDFNLLREKIVSSRIPVWYILGAATNVGAFNNLKTGVQIQDQKSSLNDVQITVPGNFSLFSLNDNVLDQVSEWPPLKSPFGVYSINGNIYTLFSQKIGTVVTKQPLLYFTEADGVKVGVLAGEGLWKWRLSDFSLNNNHDRTNEFVLRIVQYLSAKENRSPFRVMIKRNFRENESLIFDAELYNAADQLNNQPEAKLTITNAKGDQFPFVFSRTDKAYTLNVGQYPVGNYKFKAEVNNGGQILLQQGEFSVNALQLETTNTVADHQMLYALSNRTGGISILPASENALMETLKKREDVKPVSFTRKRLEDLVNVPWVFALIMLLLSLEWFLKKRAGSY
jgi:hypothetical protein